MVERTLQNYQRGKIPIKFSTVKEVELVELLGSGAFGTVWKVCDTKTKKLYVLKIIQGIKPGAILADRIRLEAEVTIPSRHIVPVLGLCEWDSSTFLILFEFFPARSLDKILVESNLTPQQKKEIFNQILIGVADAHRNNVIHRDLKPENVLVGKDNFVKLIDFGVSKFKGKGLTLTGDIIGTPPYMSPELLIHGSKIADARVDIYALGHLLYEMSMGYNFWARQGWRNFDGFVNYLTQDPKPTECIDLSDFYCDFYDNGAKVLVRMVKTDPNERYATVDEVIKDLGQPKPEIPVTIQGKRASGFPLDLPYPLLVVESGTNQNAYTMVNIETGGNLELGRASIAGNDQSVSSRHLMFSRVADRYFVNDLKSKNGTLLRGVILDPDAPPIEIHHGDRIKVGDIFLRFVFPRSV